MRFSVLFLMLTISLSTYSQISGKYSLVSGEINFVSKADLEIIKSTSKALKGAIDPVSHLIAFKIANNSFIGFNSQLQRDHFNENYMESDLFPNCTFSGKIIDEVNFMKEGTYPVRAKGVLTIKGVSQERIVKGIVYIKGDELFLTAEFVVNLRDHDIRIPRIVQQKIAPEIEVSLTSKMKLLK
ncbi:MAG: YceI family protein [Bacteroidetes bacterium]|nr:YceI family protein [Bacteroidota bacterium]